MLIPHVIQNPPKRYLKCAVSNQITIDELRGQLVDDLRQKFGEPDLIMKPSVKVLFKYIAYETIHNPKFKEALSKAKIPQNRLKQLFHEHDAAPEKEKTS